MAGWAPSSKRRGGGGLGPIPKEEGVGGLIPLFDKEQLEAVYRIQLRIQFDIEYHPMGIQSRNVGEYSPGRADDLDRPRKASER